MMSTWSFTRQSSWEYPVLENVARTQNKLAADSCSRVEIIGSHIKSYGVSLGNNHATGMPRMVDPTLVHRIQCSNIRHTSQCLDTRKKDVEVGDQLKNIQLSLLRDDINGTLQDNCHENNHNERDGYSNKYDPLLGNLKEIPLYWIILLECRTSYRQIVILGLKLSVIMLSYLTYIQVIVIQHL